MKTRTSMLLLLATVIVAFCVWHAVDERAPFHDRLGAGDLGDTPGHAAGNAGQDLDDGLSVGALSTKQEQRVADTAATRSTAGPAARFHPRQLSADNQQRIQTLLQKLEAPENPSMAYMLDVKERLANEEPDAAWGRKVRMNLDEDFARLPGLLHNLEVSDVQCAKSVCAIYAVSPVDSTDAPGTDWQRFLGETFGQPQWRTELEPRSTVVSSVDGRVVYITYAERK